MRDSAGLVSLGASSIRISMNYPHLNRRSFAAMTALSATSLSAPALWAQSPLEKTRISIAVGDKASFYCLPLSIAEQLGYFKAEGLDVEINDFAGGARALQAVAAGGVDVVSGAFEHTIRLQSKGQKFQAFVLQGRAPAIAMGISHKTMPHYKTVSDLKGKRIGISESGASSQLVAGLILSRAGLLASDVAFVSVGTAAGALMAVRAGQIDALSHMDPVMTLLEKKDEIRIIADTRSLKGTVDVFEGPMQAACLFASLEFVQKNPHTVQALTNAMTHSLKWLQTAGPSDIIKTVPEAYLLGDRALYLAAFNKVREAISPDGMIADEGTRTALRVLAKLDSSVKVDKIELSKTYTNEFSKKAKMRFKA